MAWLVRCKAKWQDLSALPVCGSLSHTHTTNNAALLNSFVPWAKEKKKKNPHKRGRALSPSLSKAVEHEAVAGPIPLPNDIQQDNVAVPLSSVL